MKQRYYPAIKEFFFDVVDFTHSNHKELKEHIQRVGKVIYENKII